MAEPLTLVGFLTARLDEDEAVARAVVPLGYNTDMGGNRQDETFSHTRWGRAGEDGAPRRLPGGGGAAHFARHDPRRVLREVEAKRAVIDDAFSYEATIDGEWGCCHSAEQIRAGECGDMRTDDITTLRHLAAVYADHPDFDPAWQV